VALLWGVVAAVGDGGAGGGFDVVLAMHACAGTSLVGAGTPYVGSDVLSPGSGAFVVVWLKSTKERGAGTVAWRGGCWRPCVTWVDAGTAQ
jgi:hypothetical protein